MNDLRLVNLNTGEFTDYSKEDEIQIITKHQRELKKYFDTKQKNKQYRKEYYKELGDFIFAIYKKCEEYELSQKLTSPEITRIIYLSTFITYDNKLVFDNGVAITKKNANTIIKLSKSVYYDFISKLLDLNIIIEKDNELYINKKLFFKGKIENKNLKNNDIIRIYVRAIRYLYGYINKKQHKQLGYLFKLIPYINKYHNIICYNTDESNIRNIRRLKLKDFAEIIGVDADYIPQLRKELLSIRSNLGTGVICLIENDTNIQNKSIIVNPGIISAIKNIDDHNNVLSIFFENKYE